MGARGVQLPSEDAARSARVPTDSSKLPYPVSGTPLALGDGTTPTQIQQANSSPVLFQEKRLLGKTLQWMNSRIVFT